jgi:hypothetical protein
MSAGLYWIRHRQRRFARALLPLFGLVWLQLAAVPCIGAHQVAAAGAAEAAFAGEVAGQVADHHGAAKHEHCPYCPPVGDAAQAGHCDDGGQCTYPHEPGVDARTASMAVLPTAAVTPLAGLLEAPCSLAAAQADRPDPRPQRSLSISYCRFIE